MAAPSPVIALTVGGLITFKARANSVATITTSLAHGLAVGDIVTIAGEDGTFNGTGLTVTSVPSTTTFTFAIGAGTLATTAGSGTGKITPTTVVLQTNRPSLAINAVESGSNGTVNPGGRVWRNSTTPAGVVDTPAVLKVRRAGTILVNCNVTNTDPLTAASSNTSITVTDAVAAAATTALNGGTVIPPPQLPFAWQDPTVATPGLPTAAELEAVSLYGGVLPTASQKLALSGA